MTIATRVSVLMPARNSEDTIFTAILSLQNQTVQDWELIVIDDGSLDKTASIVEKFILSDSRIRLLRHETSQGTGAARSLGAREAKGDVLAFLDSDDIWLPRKLERSLPVLETMNCSWLHNSYRYMDAKHQLSRPIHSYSVESFKDLLGSNPIALSTVMLRKEIYPLDLQFSFRRAQDLELWIALSREGHTCKYLDVQDVIYRLRRGSHSSNKVAAAIRRIHNIRKLKLGLAPTLISYVRYAVGSLLKLRRRLLKSKNSPEIENFRAPLDGSAFEFLVSEDIRSSDPPHQGALL